ncbi:adenylate kinase family protein [Candidatus Bathyarchaeota archaeon]|nr:adenylate kinase family protein [Candidatus Bathyarchaeota archaeon]
MEKRVYIFTGVPGVGKTSAAVRLAERLDASYVNLSTLVIEKNLYSSKDEANDAFEVDVEKAHPVIKHLIESSNRTLVIDGHLASDIVDRESASLVFVLRRAPWILKSELEVRGYSKEKVRENIEAELIGVCLTDAIRVFGANRVCEIDTTSKSIDMIVEEALSMIHGERRCLSSVVDWLALADPEWLRSI